MILQPIDRNEALRYLGCKDGTDNEQMLAMLDSCEKQLLKAASPKYLYAVYPISFTDDGVRISDSNIILKGNSAAAHLKNCDRIVLMCATLGQGVDVLLRHLQVSDMASAVIVDSLAGAAIEQVCNRAETEIFEKVRSNSRTWRYSPGYGDLPLDRPDLFFTEETPIHTSSPYSASKASADLLVLAYHRTYGLPVTISRCSNNYGPYHFPEKLIPLIIKNILAGQKLPVYGKGDNVRDWLYVEDHAKAIDAVLERGRIGEVYNVGGFNEEQNINIVKLIIGIIARIMREEPEYRRVLKTDVKNINEDLITFVGDRPGHDMRYAIDPSKIARELGWYPETPFTVGIEKTVRWYLDHQDWVDEVVSGDYQKYYEQMYGNR